MKPTFEPDEIREKLRAQIRRLEGFKGGNKAGCLPLGVSIEDCLPGSALALGAVHEFISAGYEDAASSLSFILAVLSPLPMPSPIIWVARDHVQYAPGFAFYGIDAQHIIFVRPQKDAQALWVMEEALRCKGIAAVVGECAMADLTATRRLQLAAEESGVPGLLLRPAQRVMSSSSCVTRWQVRPAPSIPEGLPGLGVPRWQVELLKARGGRPGSWIMEWRDQALFLATMPKPEICQPHKTAGQIVPFALRT